MTGLCPCIRHRCAAVTGFPIAFGWPHEPLASAWSVALAHPPRITMRAAAPGLPSLELGPTRCVHLVVGGRDHPRELDTYDFGPLDRAGVAAFPDAPFLRIEGMIGMDLLMADGAIIDFGTRTLFIAR